MTENTRAGDREWAGLLARRIYDQLDFGEMDELAMDEIEHAILNDPIVVIEDLITRIEQYTM